MEEASIEPVADDRTDQTDQIDQTEAPSVDHAAAAQAAMAEATTVVEAILFASDSPLTGAKIASAGELPGRGVTKAIAHLNQRYEQTGAAFRIEEIAGGYQMLTLPEYNDVLSRLLRAKSDSKLSQAALETLAIVAYRQPIIRADVESIRGVACGEMLRSLMERGMVKIVGRAEVLGRPMLYGTTRHFLDVFGLAKLDDLPRIEELRTAAGQAATPQQQASPAAEEPDESPAADDGDGTRNHADQPSPAEDDQAEDDQAED